MKEPSSSGQPARAVSLILYTAVVITVAMVAFPPYTSFYGTEYAFMWSGPEWARSTEATLNDLELTVRIHWDLLIVQLLSLWAIALGAKWILGKQPVLMTLLGFSIVRISSYLIVPILL